jgi:probable F420-dependent oxidoreductase
MVDPMAAPSVTAGLPTTRVDAPDEFLTGDAVAEIASAFEDCGFDGCHVTDHPAPDARWLDGGGHHALDPFVALSFAAAATTRLQLQTYIYVAAYRNPFLSAQSALSLDLLSGGRLTLGMAAGYLKPEYGALGVDFDERNELLEEAIEVMKLAWTGEDVAYQGRHFRARGVRLAPRPRADPHPPIWMGGNTTRAIRRAVEMCQGWAPFRTTVDTANTRTSSLSSVDELRAKIAVVRRLCDETGRTEPLDICFSAGLSGAEGVPADRKRAELEELAEAGVSWVSVGFDTFVHPGAAPTRRAVIDQARRYADEVLSTLR